jgi:ATP-dependent Lon protease
MLDEIDKLGADFRGDPGRRCWKCSTRSRTLPFQITTWKSLDLSKVMFITTANTLGSIPPALLDRMEVIEFPGYIEEEKLEIANRFLIPRQMEESGLERTKIQFKEQAIRRIIREYTYEAGVRNLEREIGRMCRKVARLKSEKKLPAPGLAPAWSKSSSARRSSSRPRPSARMKLAWRPLWPGPKMAARLCRLRC